jgi:hypothetical protein
VQRTRGPVAVSTWLYLTPAVSAAWAWAMFEEQLSLLTVAGFAVSLTGVLVTRAGARTPATKSHRSGETVARQTVLLSVDKVDSEQHSLAAEPLPGTTRPGQPVTTRGPSGLRGARPS